MVGYQDRAPRGRHVLAALHAHRKQPQPHRQAQQAVRREARQHPDLAPIALVPLPKAPHEAGLFDRRIRHPAWQEQRGDQPGQGGRSHPQAGAECHDVEPRVDRVAHPGERPARRQSRGRQRADGEAAAISPEHRHRRGHQRPASRRNHPAKRVRSARPAEGLVEGAGHAPEEHRQEQPEDPEVGGDNRDPTEPSAPAGDSRSHRGRAKDGVVFRRRALEGALVGALG
jgi:hypothetical protein